MADVVPAQNTDALLQSLLQKLSASSGSLASNVVPFRQRQQAIEQKIDAVEPPAPPELTPIPTKAPDPQYTNIFKALSPDMMALAALGGALTGAPITATLQNATGFLKGIHEGDEQATKDHLEQFNTNLNAAKDANAAALEKYRTVLDSKNFDMNKMNGQLRSIANEYGDPITMHAIETGDLKGLAQIVEAREAMQTRLQNHQDMINLRVEGSWGPTLDFTLKDGKKVQGERNKLTGQIRDLAGNEIDRSQITREDRQALPARSAPALALQKYIQDKENAGQTVGPEDVLNFASDYASRVKAARDWGTGPLGNQTRSFNVGLYHLDTLQELADALKNGDTKAFNKLANEWGVQTGNPAPTNFETAKQIIGAEVVKAIVGAGGGGVQERLEAANHIGASMSPEQMTGAIDTTQALMVGQLRGLKQQYERTTKNTDFEDAFLSPEARALFEKETQKAPDQAGGDLSAKAKAAWGSYEPDKYEYRVNPDTGQLQRRAK